MHIKGKGISGPEAISWTPIGHMECWDIFHGFQCSNGSSLFLSYPHSYYTGVDSPLSLTDHKSLQLLQITHIIQIFQRGKANKFHSVRFACLKKGPNRAVIAGLGSQYPKNTHACLRFPVLVLVPYSLIWEKGGSGWIKFYL